MEVSESMYKIFKLAAQVKIQRGEDGYEVLAEYAKKISNNQIERMTKELIEEGYLKQERRNRWIFQQFYKNI